MATLSFSGRHFHQDMILQSMRWYLAYSLSYRDIEEMMHERGFSTVAVDEGEASFYHQSENSSFSGIRVKAILVPTFSLFSVPNCNVEEPYR